MLYRVSHRKTSGRAWRGLGHEFRAIQARIRDHFGGSPLALIQWIDDNHPQPAA